MRRIYDGEAKPCVAGGDVALSFPAVPLMDHGEPVAVDAMLIVIDAVLTTGAGGGCTMRELLAHLSNVEVAPTGVDALVSGVSCLDLYQLLMGVNRTYQWVPADQAASTTGQVNHIVLRIPFSDGFAAPEQHAQPAALFGAGTVRIRLNSGAINANTTILGITVRTALECRRTGKVRVAALPKIRGVNADSSATLEDATYRAVLLKKTDNGVFTSAGQITNINVSTPRSQIIQSAAPNSVLGAYVTDFAPLAGFGELGAAGMPGFVPGGVDFATQYSSINMIPLIWPSAYENENTLTEMVDGALRVETDGSLTSLRLVYYALKPMSESEAAGVLARAGLSSDSPAYREGAGGQPIRSTDKPGLRAAPIVVVGSNRPNLVNL